MSLHITSGSGRSSLGAPKTQDLSEDGGDQSRALPPEVISSTCSRDASSTTVIAGKSSLSVALQGQWRTASAPPGAATHGPVQPCNPTTAAGVSAERNGGGPLESGASGTDVAHLCSSDEGQLIEDVCFA